MDAVITYVNGLDPLWQADYCAAMNVPILEKRFRDWGTLRFLLRGIEANMPFVERVFLVVSRESQVPSWVNRDTVRVVLHEEIVPSAVLPVFNSNPIELHLHRIAGLGERYLYFNDDMFPMNPCCEEDFYCDGRPAMNFATHVAHFNSFMSICRNSDRLALKALGRRAGLTFKRPQHICSPMLRSACEEVYSLVSEEILRSLTRVRTRENVTQYLFLDYLFHSGRAISRRIPAKMFSLATNSPAKISAAILGTKLKLICINDVRIAPERFEAIRDVLHAAFSEKFPAKSRFEL